MTTKPRLVVNQFHNLDFPNAKELKHCSSTMLPKTRNMEISANLKYFGKEEGRTLDLGRMHQG
jgi:hypothetical protein